MDALPLCSVTVNKCSPCSINLDKIQVGKFYYQNHQRALQIVLFIQTQTKYSSCGNLCNRLKFNSEMIFIDYNR